MSWHSVVSSGAMAFGARDKERTPHSFWEINAANGIMATVAITFQLIQLLKGESPAQFPSPPNGRPVTPRVAGEAGDSVLVSKDYTWFRRHGGYEKLEGAAHGQGAENRSAPVRQRASLPHLPSPACLNGFDWSSPAWVLLSSLLENRNGWERGWGGVSACSFILQHRIPGPGCRLG